MTGVTFELNDCILVSFKSLVIKSRAKVAVSKSELASVSLASRDTSTNTVLPPSFASPAAVSISSIGVSFSSIAACMASISASTSASSTSAIFTARSELFDCSFIRILSLLTLSLMILSAMIPLFFRLL